MSTSRDFWSRRRAGVAAEQAAESEAALSAQQADAREELESKTDEDILAELDLPRPEDLKPGDDFSAFMSKAVPDRIRRRALRTLWRSNPLLANVDGLVEYGEDFTDSATVIEDLQTAYQVGKGMLTHVLEMAKENEPAAVAAEEAEELIVAEETVEPEPDIIETVQAAPVEEEPNEAPIPRRRMRFEFEEA